MRASGSGAAGRWWPSRAPACSTASGVPDFRSPGGVWSRYRPVPIQEFLASEEARRDYWRYKRETYAQMAQARGPTPRTKRWRGWRQRAG